jgi:CrcB protein
MTMSNVVDSLTSTDVDAFADSDNDAVVDASHSSLHLANHDEVEGDTNIKPNSRNLRREQTWLTIIYLSLFSVVGSSLRIFMGRFFGGDCDLNVEGGQIDDFLWSSSHKICITTSGKTEQYGGALFVDLPANMLGSFIMGYNIGHSVNWPAIPCLAYNHPLQFEKGLQIGITTGFCGSLTTLSSWNSQMVMMMNGNANPYLGSQVPAALFGYILGLQTSIVSFRAGRALAVFVHAKRNPYIFNNDLCKKGVRRKWYHDHLYWITPMILLIISGTLIAVYAAGDMLWGIPYYRQVWFACILAPLGSILRWKLSLWNGKFSFPLGTFVANFAACVISSAITSLVIVKSEDDLPDGWMIPTMQAISLGFTGCLSTVSTFARECVEIGERNPPDSKMQFLYSHGTLLICCITGYFVYSLTAINKTN